MRRLVMIPLLLILVLLPACSIELSDRAPEPTVFVPVIGTGQPTPADSAPTVAATELAPAQWSALGLVGRLQYTDGKEGIKQLDLATGETRIVFAPPADTWLTAAAASPDGSRLAVAYAPPPPAGTAQLGYTGLYALSGACLRSPAGCAAADLAPLIPQTIQHEAFFSPIWSPDGQALYFAHFTPSQGGASQPFKYTVERMPLPAGERRVLAEHAIWPAVSPDGVLLAYVFLDPVDYSNDLYLANADGSGQRILVEPTLFEAVDAPFFTQDGAYVVFSAVGRGDPAAPTPPPAARWLDWLLGARVAYAAPDAHNVPSDWWRVPVAGGPPERLTHIFDTGLFGAAAPGGDWLAFLSASGVYVMRLDGTDLTRLSRDGGSGTLQWLEP